MCYSFNLSHSRTLKCNIFVNTLPKNISWPSKYFAEFAFRLGNVCVNDEQPPIQVRYLNS